MNVHVVPDAVTVRVCLDPARGLWRLSHVHAGQTLQEIHGGLSLPYEGLRGLLGVRVGDWVVPRDKWSLVRPKPAAVVVFSPEIGGPALGLIFAGLSAVAKTAAAGIAGKMTVAAIAKAALGKLFWGAVSIAASLAIQGLMRPKEEDEEAPRTVGSAGTQGEFEPGAYFKLWMGEFKDTLQVTVPSFTEIDGDDQLAVIGVSAVGLFTDPILYAGDVELTTVQDREVVIWEASEGEGPPEEVLALVPDTRIERTYDIILSAWETDTDDDHDDAVEIDGTVEETEPLWHAAEALLDAEVVRFEYTLDALVHITDTDMNAALVVLRHRFAKRATDGTWGAWVNIPQLLIRAKEPNHPLRIQFYIHFVDAYPAAPVEEGDPDVGNDWPPVGETFENVAGWGDIFEQNHASLATDKKWLSPLLTASGSGFTQWWWESEQKVHLYLLKSSYPLGRYKFEVKRSWPFHWSGYNATTNSITSGELGLTIYDFFSAIEVSAGLWKIPHNPRNYRETITLTTFQMSWPEFPIQPQGVDKTHVFIRVRNQSIGPIRALWTRKISAWNGSTWLANQASSNPGALYRNVLKGVHNAKPVPDALINDASMVDLYEWCEAGDKECRMTLPGGGSVEEALKAVALTAHARPVQAPLHSVIIDRPREDGPVGLITSRSANGFSFEKLFVEKPHALDVAYVSAIDDYETRQIRVYASGYNIDGSGGLIEAERFQAISYPGIVGETQAIARANLDLAWIWYRDRPVYCTQALLAREHEPGDLVLVETEILGRVNGRGRIKDWTVLGGLGGDGLRDIPDLRDVHDLRAIGLGTETVSAITIDEAPFFGTTSLDLRKIANLRALADLRAPANRGIAIRERNGDVRVLEVSDFNSETKEIVLATPTALDIEIGDEVATGPLGLEAREMLVWNMVPRGRNLTQIMLLDYAKQHVYQLPVEVILSVAESGSDTVAMVAAHVPWTPLDLGAKLKAWWSADSTSDGVVATWTDSVSGIAVTAAAGLQPVSAATSFNGHRGLTFDGTDDCFVTTTLTALPTGATAGEIWALASDTATASPRFIIRYGNAAGVSRGLYRSTVSTVDRAGVTDATTNLVDTVADITGPHIWGGDWSGTTMAGRLDGQAMTPSSTTIATLATATTRLRIGAVSATTAANFWQGVIRHVLITTTLTSTEREQLEGWLAHNSGLTGNLPSGHPWKSIAP